MILKCARDSKGSWRVFDGVHNIRYTYYSMKKHNDETLIAEYGTPYSDLFVWEDPDVTAGNILVIEFSSDGRDFVIMTHYQTFLMNDDGRTIERLRN